MGRADQLAARRTGRGRRQAQAVDDIPRERQRARPLHASQRDRSFWPGVGAGWGWDALVLASTIFPIRRPIALLALTRSIGTSGCSAAAASPASWSALSFPSSPAWPGTHWKVTVVPRSPRACSCFQMLAARAVPWPASSLELLQSGLGVR